MLIHKRCQFPARRFARALKYNVYNGTPLLFWYIVSTTGRLDCSGTLCLQRNAFIVLVHCVYNGTPLLFWYIVSTTERPYCSGTLCIQRNAFIVLVHCVYNGTPLLFWYIVSTTERLYCSGTLCIQRNALISEMFQKLANFSGIKGSLLIRGLKIEIKIFRLPQRPPLGSSTSVPHIK
jgi:hypothetical protein